MTVVELLVAMSLLLVIGGAALTLGISARDFYETDRARTRVNQNLRAGLDLLGLDVRQAGERLPGDIPAMEVIDGGEGPDTLIVRRNLLDPVLPVCKKIKANTNADAVFIRKENKADKNPGCAGVPDENGDGWPDNLEVWREYRIANGGAVWAYVYNPVSGDGEFILYDAEDSSGKHIHKDNAEKWQHTYKVTDLARIYILEQRTYQLSDDLLRLTLNGDTDNPMNLVDRIDDFQVQVHMQDGTTVDSFGPSDDWTEVRSMQVTLTGSAQDRDREVARTWTTEFFPRNVLSR